MGAICLHCKRVHADTEVCPYEKSYREFFSSPAPIGDHLEGASPSIFVGRFGYPKVHVGFLAPQGIRESELMDAPKLWAQQNFQIPDIAALRRSLVQSRFEVGIQEQNRQLGMAQEIAMSAKPVDVDIMFQQSPKQLDIFDGISAPFGPTGHLKAVDLTSNPHIPTAVEAAVGDTHATATTVMGELYGKNYDEHTLTKLLSVGTLGQGSLRKLVPTRWAITAVDDSLGKMLREQIQDFSFCEHKIHFGGYLGNFFLIFFFPEKFRYELFEMNTGSPLTEHKSLPYTTDYESFAGRTGYVQETAGGYYACRFSILEKLIEEHEQGSVLALRFITPEYTAPLGVWVVRQATRASLNSSPVFCSSRTELLAKAKSLIQEKLQLDISYYLKKSKLLEEISSQKKLSEFW